MLVLWRIVLLVLTTIGVLICFPYYNKFGVITAFLVFLAGAVGMAVITWLTNILFLSRSKVFNFLLDIVLVIAFIILLLLFIPQEGPQNPIENLKKGKYPSEADINYGLVKLGVKKQSDAFKQEIKGGIDQFKSGINKIETIVPED